MVREGDLPEEEIWVGHKVGDTLQHAPWLENEGWEGHFVEIHADSDRTGGSANSVFVGGRIEGRRAAYRSWEIREAMIEPSFSSL